LGNPLERPPTENGNAVAKIRKTEKTFVIACNHETGFWKTPAYENITYLTFVYVKNAQNE
jgi:hypothetical protein